MTRYEKIDHLQFFDAEFTVELNGEGLFKKAELWLKICTRVTRVTVHNLLRNGAIDLPSQPGEIEAARTP